MAVDLYLTVHNLLVRRLLRLMRTLSDMSQSRATRRGAPDVMQFQNISTDGIDIEDMVMYRNRQPALRLSTWDFAGQGAHLCVCIVCIVCVCLVCVLSVCCSPVSRIPSPLSAVCHL